MADKFGGAFKKFGKARGYNPEEEKKDGMGGGFMGMMGGKMEGEDEGMEKKGMQEGKEKEDEEEEGNEMEFEGKDKETIQKMVDLFDELAPLVEQVKEILNK